MNSKKVTIKGRAVRLAQFFLDASIVVLIDVITVLINPGMFLIPI